MRKEIKRVLNGKANIAYTESLGQLVLDLTETMETAAKSTSDPETFKTLQVGFTKAKERFDSSKGGQI